MKKILYGREKIPKYVNILLAVLCAVMFIIYGVAIVMLVVEIATPTSEIEQLYVNMPPVSVEGLPKVDFSLFANGEDIKQYIILAKIFSIICLTPLVVILYSAKRISDCVQKQEIFSEKVSRSILIIAIISLILMMLEVNSIAVFAVLFAQPFMSDLVFGASAPLEVYKNTGFTIDLYEMVIIGVLFLIYYCFKHGEKLQQLSDETL